MCLITSDNSHILLVRLLCQYTERVDLEHIKSMELESPYKKKAPTIFTLRLATEEVQLKVRGSETWWSIKFEGRRMCARAWHKRTDVFSLLFFSSHLFIALWAADNQNVCCLCDCTDGQSWHGRGVEGLHPDCDQSKTHTLMGWLGWCSVYRCCWWYRIFLSARKKKKKHP